MHMIRKAVNEDVDNIYRLICLLEETTFDYETFKMIYEKQLNDNNHFFLVYEDNGIHALCHFVISYHLHHCAKVCDIYELVVNEECRGKGIGKQLLQEVDKISKEYQCVQVELDTNQRRKNAHRFYEREGMKQTHYCYTKKLEK